MKKILVCSICILLTVSLIFSDLFPMINAFAEDSSAETVVTIKSSKDLLDFAGKVNGGTNYSGMTIELKADIDMQGETWPVIGYNLNHYFAGTFNGNGYTISNLNTSVSIDSVSILSAPIHTVGLFGVCLNAKVKDVVIENASFSIENESGYTNSYSSIYSTSVYGGNVCAYAKNSTFNNLIVNNSSVYVYTGAESAYAYAGGIVGYAENCNFAHCRNESGSVKGYTDSLSNDACAGGLIGEYVNEGTVRQCYNKATISSKASNSCGYAGGLIGKSTNNSTALSTVRDSFNRGQVSFTGSWLNNEYLGGIIGYSSSTVNRCYNAGTVKTSTNTLSSSYVGGIAGNGISSSIIGNSAVVCSTVSGGTANKIISNGGTKQNNIANSSLTASNDANYKLSASSFYGSQTYVDYLSWDFESIWSAVSGDYPTLQYHDADTEGNIIITDKIASGLEIIFADGDDYDHVTRDVTLPVDFEDATVTWASSNDSVLNSDTGEVTRQEEEYLVKVSATITSGNYTTVKRFVVNVMPLNDEEMEEPADWAMTPDEARSLIALIRGCKIKDIDNDDQDYLVLTGRDTDEDHVVNTVCKVIDFWEVPVESAYLKSYMNDVIGLIKSGQDAEISKLIGDMSDGYVKWAKDEDDPENEAKLNKATIAKNLIAIPEATLGVKTGVVDGYKAIKGMTDIKYEQNGLDTTFKLAGKVGGFMDFALKQAGSSGGIGKFFNLIKYTCQGILLFDAYEKAQENAVKAYMSMYMQNRPNFDSPDDPVFQLLMSAHMVTSIKTNVENIDELAEGYYKIYSKFSGGLEDKYKITVMCPVDVFVYDEAGRIVGRVVDNVVDTSISNSLLITVGGENNDEKTILFEDDENYSIILEGNDAGSMNIVMETLSSGTRKVCEYEDIVLEDGKKMSMDISTDIIDGEDAPEIVVFDGGAFSTETEELDGAEKKHYLVLYPCTLDENGDTVLTMAGGYCESNYVLPGTDILSLVVVNDGYILDGLFYDSEFTEPVEDSRMPDEELTVYARFRENNTGINITSHPQSAEYQQGDSPEALTVVVADGSDYSCQWYSYIDKKSDAAAIEGATGFSYYPDTGEIGTTYYFAVVTYKSGSEDKSLESYTAVVTVKEKTMIDSGSCGDNVNWVLSVDGVLTVSGDGPMADFDNEDAPWSEYSAEIKEIAVIENVESIGSNAFADLNKVKKISVCDTVESIAEGAFSGCDSLEELTIPFVGLSRDAADENAVLGSVFGAVSTGGVTQYHRQDEESLYGYSYGIPSSLRKVTVTDAVSLSFGAFFNCKDISEIILNEGIEAIAEYSMCNCSGLKELVIPSTVSLIQEYALKGCSSLESVTLPFVGESIDCNETYNAVFGHIFGRTSEGVQQYYTTDGTYVYGYKYGIPATLAEVIITADTDIPFGAFSGCSDISNVSLGETESVAAYAFYNCTGLENVSFSGDAPEIDMIAFANCGVLSGHYPGGNSTWTDDVLLNYGAQKIEWVSVIVNESIELDRTSVSLAVGETVTLTAAVTPAGNAGSVFWQSSDESVATVENGKVTANGAGTATITATAGDVSASCVVTVTAAEIDYSLTPAIKGAASKLYEPWGLKYFASYDGDDVDKITERGVVMLKDEFYTAGMTPEEFRASENAYDFSSARDELGFEAPSAKYPNGRYTALLDEGIYSYDISAAYYALPYAVMENGQIVYGAIRNISMEQVLNSNLSSSAVSAEEKTICTCILALKDSVATYYSATGIQGASIDIHAPRGSSQIAAAKVMTAAEAGITPAVKGAASRLIEPWGLKFTAAYTADSRIADRGIVMLREDSYSDTYASNQDAMRLNAEAYVFTEGDETLQYVASSDRYSALLTEGISSRDISAAYYAAPFVVLNDGTYVYGTVRSISMLNILNTNLSSSAVSAEEKAVCQDIIDLYNAVKAYYEAV